MRYIHSKPLFTKPYPPAPLVKWTIGLTLRKVGYIKCPKSRTRTKEKCLYANRENEIYTHTAVSAGFRRCKQHCALTGSKIRGRASEHDDETRREWKKEGKRRRRREKKNRRISPVLEAPYFSLSLLRSRKWVYIYIYMLDMDFSIDIVRDIIQP